MPRTPPSRLLARILCGGASTLTGIALVPLIWTLRLEIAVLCAVVYGAGLGTPCVLWLQVLEDCGSVVVRSTRSLSVFTLVFGLCLAAAIVGGAAVFQGYENGVDIILAAVAGRLALEGLVLGVGDGVEQY
jgi:hypothetical protein